VADGLGGRVAGVPGNTECVSNCTIQAADQTLVSLFALPDKGYRFKSWYGKCANTLGPLCTLRADEDIRVGARFVKTEAPQMPAKALLLLHDERDKHTVWNEFVKQRFNNRCPIVYGGVVLGDDSFDSHNNVYCYRIAFGYYDMLNHGETARGLQKVGDTRKAKDRFSGKRLGYEVRAAVLGVSDRHPNLNLTLLGQAHAALAAQSFLQADTVERTSIVGLLALQQANHNGKDMASEKPRSEIFQAEPTAVLKLNAEPDQDAKISAALAKLTKSWWMAR